MDVFFVIDRRLLEAESNDFFTAYTQGLIQF